MNIGIGIILAGGESQRFGGARACPKPLIEIASRPMILHAAAQLVQGGAQKICVLSGTNHDAICAGLGLTRNVATLAVGDLSVPFELRPSGVNSGTGGRLLSLTPAELSESALISYTDVFTRSNLAELEKTRRRTRSALTMLTVNPRSQWGRVIVEGDHVTQFEEKPTLPDLVINAGCFAVDARILDYIRDPSEMLEAEPMRRMIDNGLVAAMPCSSDWIAVDSQKDLPEIEQNSDRYIDPVVASLVKLVAL